MGIPKFARFLINRYPLILKSIQEEGDVPSIDNLYLDLNGVIHTRAHNNSLIQMCSNRAQSEIFYDVFLYVDQMVHLIKPKKVLMISADGVAPRAKMNQQRSRRFRKTKMSESEIDAMERMGLSYEDMFNSDKISAGTEFMQDLSEAFKQFLKEKLQTDFLWSGLKVIFTGSEVPGEGEHKIIEYIRNWKKSPEYLSETTHCLYGLDADLIMLSLITHEPNFCILREEVFHAKKKKPSDTSTRNSLKIRDNFEMIYVSILREYMEMEFLEIKEKIKFEFNIDRIIDDFIFFCFFIGNDFLPSLNTLDIDHGSLDNIFSYYKEVLPTLDDYITFNGKIDFKKAEKIFHLLATQELNSLRSMLKKVELQSKEREAVKNLQIEERKNTIRRKKINEKKENLFFEWKKKSESEIFSYKKNKVNSKIIDIKKKYEEEMQISGKQSFKFEDDLHVFVRENQRKMIEELTLRAHRGEFSTEVGGNEVEETPPDAEESESAGKLSDVLAAASDNLSAKQDKANDDLISNKSNANNNSSNTESDSKKLCLLFDSDEDDSNPNKKKGGDWKKSKFTKNNNNNYNANTDASVIGTEKPSRSNASKSLSPKTRLNLIFKEAERFKNYIHDENYCSDFNLLDIYDEDISEISETELIIDQAEFLIDYEKEYEESQNVDHVFQKKLVEYYITDINKAKAFYYKEKVKIDLETDEGKEQIKHMFRKYFEGLQWVLYYYYRGIQTWRWFYPYHYPPMISDFVNIKDYLDYDLESVFVRDIAYSPLESLVLILPNTSRDLIPKCLWTIYEQFAHYFPANFQIDFNGKKMPWESLVLLPFIEDGEIITEINRKIKFFADPKNFEDLEKIEKETALALQLSAKELQRNFKGKSYIIHLKPGQNGEKKLHEIEFEIYEETLDQKVFSGNYANNKKLLHDFPTLKSIQYNFSNTTKKTHGFNRDSGRKVILKKENKITLEPIALRISEKDVEKFIKNGIIFADYPMKKEGWIRGIYFNNQYYYLDRKGNVAVDAAYRLPSTVRDAITRICNKKSILIKSDIYCDVVFVKKIARNSDGSIFKIYNENASLFVPFELTSLNSNSEDFYKIIENFEELKKKFSNVKTEFDFEKPVITLCKNAWGRSGKITNIVENSHKEYKNFLELNYHDYYDEKFNVDLKGNDWHVELEKLYNGPLLEVALESSKNVTGQEVNFAKKVLYKTDEQFISLSDLAAKMKISVWTLGLITGNFFVIDCTVNSKIHEYTKLENLQHWNIGLLLKSKLGSEKIVLPGYTRYIGNPHSEESPSQFWEFSTAAVDLINEYATKFRFVIDSLERYKEMYVCTTKFFKIYELFSRETDIYKKLNEICIWKNAHPISKAHFTTMLSDFISRKDCRKIEEYIEKKQVMKEQEISEAGSKVSNDDNNNIDLKNSNEKTIKNKKSLDKLVANPNYLYQDTYPWIPPFYNYEPSGFELGDRVINIRSSDIPAIPFAMGGVVTGITDKFVEVCFDHPFFGGTTCNDRFKCNRGALVKTENLLNLSNKYPVFLRRNNQKYFSWNHEPQGDLAYEKNFSHYALPKGETQLVKQASDQIKQAPVTKKIILRKPKEINDSDVPTKEKLIMIEKHLGKEKDIEDKLDLQFSKSDNNFDEIVNERKVKEIINHSRAPVNLIANKNNYYNNYNNNNNNNNNNFNSYNPQSEHNADFKAIPKTNVNLEELKNQYNENTTKNDNKIKKIFRKDNYNINNNFNNNKFNNNNNNNNFNNDPNILNNNENRRFKDKFVQKYDDFKMAEDELNVGNTVNCTEYNQSNRIFKAELIPINSIYYFKFSSNEENNSLSNNKNVIFTNPRVDANAAAEKSLNLSQN